jgi:hypothetical protein
MTVTPDTPSRITDWTVNPGTGRSNSSDLFRDLEHAVAALLREGGGWVLDRAWLTGKAALIMAQLAHVRHLVPAQPVREAVDMPSVLVIGQSAEWQAGFEACAERVLSVLGTIESGNLAVPPGSSEGG